MPKISDEHREMRRNQILDAAWRCFHREGVQGTTMEEIIQESGLSASAMYRYFSNKEDIIFTAITTSLGGLAKLLEPMFVSRPDATPAEFIGGVTSTIAAFSARKGFNLSSIAIHGWSEAQRDERVRKLIADFYAAFRSRLGNRVLSWQAAGMVPAEANPADVAQTLLSLALGFVVQTAILRDASPEAHARGLAAL